MQAPRTATTGRQALACVAMDPTADPSAAVLAALRQRGQTLCCAESLTGGMLASTLTEVPGASQSFVGAVVAYATSVKRRVLGVSAERVVSAECAEQMAIGVRRLLAADWALATTGVAGPERQEDQPGGTVYVGVGGPGGTTSTRLQLSGDRDRIRTDTCREAMTLLLRALTGERP